MENKTYFCTTNHNLLYTCRDETNSEDTTVEKNPGVHLLSDCHSLFFDSYVVFF